MKCLIYYDIHVHALNPSTKEIKGLITYYKTYEIIALKNHVDGDHAIIVKNIEEEVNGLIRGILERHTTKTRPNVSNFALFKFFIVKDPFKKDDEQQNDFLQKLGLLIMKNQLSLQFVEVFGSNAHFYICV
jgi:hypothetical protein